MKKKTFVKAAAICSLFSAFIGMAAIKTEVSAQDTPPTYTSVADLSLSMEEGASVRKSSTLDEAGIRFQMTMPVAAHAWLMDNTGEGKLYSEVTFGMFIAPQYYHAKKPMSVESNVMGEDRVYGWLQKEETVWEESLDYTYDNTLVQILNTEGTMIVDKEDSTQYTYYGCAIGMREENLLTEYVGVGYIRYTQGTETHYQFATAADNVRSMTYVAQLAVDSGELKDTVAEEKKIIDTYVGTVASQQTTYTLEYYAPDGTQLKTEDKTANVNEKITVSSANLSTVEGYVFNEHSNPDLWTKNGYDATSIQKTVYANGNTTLKVYLDDATLYDFEESSTLDNTRIYANGATMQITNALPTPFQGQGLKLNFTGDWVYVSFYDWTGEKLSRAIAAGYSYLKMDVYYEGANTSDIVWVTPFGLTGKTFTTKNYWVTLSFDLKASGSNFGSDYYGIAFNVSGQADYNVYVDNIRLGKDTIATYEYLYDGFESETSSSNGWKYLSWWNGVQSIDACSTDVAKAGNKSLKITPSEGTMNLPVALKDGNNVVLDNAWIKARAGKTLSFWMYYKNDAYASDLIWLTIKNGASGSNYSVKSHQQGKWSNIVIDLDEIQDWTQIYLNINSNQNQLPSGTIYFDHFEVY